MIVAVLFSIAAMVCFEFFAYNAHKSFYRLRNHHRASATVVRYWPIDGSEGVSYYPVVRFIVDGRQLHAITPYGGSGKPWERGTEINVIYDPSNPADAELITFGALWLLPIVSGGFALMCMTMVCAIAKNNT